MATDAKILGAQSPVSESPSASLVKERRTEEKQAARVRKTEPLANGARDLILCHNTADGPWTAKLADQLRAPQFRDRELRLSFANWNAVTGTNALVEAGNGLLGLRFFAIVVSKAMLQEDWLGAQRSIELLQEVPPAKWRVVTILKDNVTIPPPLRMGEWFDFRNANQFEEGISDLTSFLMGNFGSSGRAYSFEVSSIKERLLSNLFPVLELPKFVHSTKTRFENESELAEACAAAGPLPVMIKDSRLYTFERLSPDSALAPAVARWDTYMQENFAQWLSRQDRAEWAIELLNHMFRQHVWKRGLRWDKTTDQYHFPRTKPKSLWWEIGGRTISREVTAPQIESIELENRERAEFQSGWRHQTIRAGFVQVRGALFLRLQPDWLLTELDGKTPATSQPVGPVLSGVPHQERNGQVLRSLRFWSAILSKGHHEIRINTGQAPVRIKLTPLSGFTQFGIPSDQTDYDRLMRAESEDDLLIPALGPLEQESIFDHEESLSSQALGN